MLTITTWIIVETVIVVGGVVLIATACAWWRVTLVAPSLVLAVWISSQEHTRPRHPALLGALVFAQTTWAVAVLMGVDIPAAVPVAAIGAVAVATATRSRSVRAVGVLAMMGAASLLSPVRSPESTFGYLVGSLQYGVVFIGSLWLNDIVWRLFTEFDDMRAKEDELAVVKERTRLVADLHDIQGRTLHVIKLKAAVTAKLRHVDPERVAAELADIERLSRETIDQAQRLVNSTRELSFRGELANATALLTATGIDVDVVGEHEHRGVHEESFALVLREATTNILRHPSARSVGIATTADVLVINNDGAAGTGKREHGLANLRECVAQSGGVLDAMHAGAEFTLSLAMDGDAS